MRLDAPGAKESASLIAKYHKKMEKEMPILNPMEALQLMFKLMDTGKPEDVFDPPAIPIELSRLYTDARVAIDRYHSAFADIVMHHEPYNTRITAAPPITNKAKWA